MNLNENIIKEIAEKEDIEVEELKKLISEGKVVIPYNKVRHIKTPCAIGKKLSTKINVNIGTSPARNNIEEEIKKAKLAVELAADTIMDLSIGGDIDYIRKRIIEKVTIPVGSVPIYQVFVQATNNIKAKDILKVIEKHAKDGIDFMTIHAGMTKDLLNKTYNYKRIIKIVSRGGALLAKWMQENNKENPLFEHFDDILAIAKEYGVVLSIGDCLRPGSIIDANDKLQREEIKIISELVIRAKQKGVQVIVEGPGHVPLNKIEYIVKFTKKVCHEVPLYVLGPLVTDIALGYDNIAGAIGGALAAMYGADFLCYVTPAEHLCLPTLEDVYEGIAAMKIAAHAADIAKGIKSKINKDKELSICRAHLDWEGQGKFAILPQKAKEMIHKCQPINFKYCSMCSYYCAVKLAQNLL